MNVQDIAEIRNRAKALYDWLQRLDALTALHRDRSIRIADAIDLSLTAAQRTAIRERTAELAGRMRSLADSLPAPTGRDGTPNSDGIANVERQPQLAVVILESLIERQLNPLLGVSLRDQADGTFGFEFEEADAEQIADTMATARDQAKIYIGVLEARLAN